MKNILKKIVDKIYAFYINLLLDKILQLSWPIFKFSFKQTARNKIKHIPGETNFSNALILVGSSRHNSRGIDLNESIEGWLKENLNITNCVRSKNLKKQPKPKGTEIIVVTLSWLKSKYGHHLFFLPIYIAAFRFRLRRSPIWVMLGDTFNLQWTIPACILVSNCGGGIILQANSSDEAEKFGIIHPIGPFIWTLNKSNYRLFFSELDWKDRENIVVFANSGDPIRTELLQSYREVVTNQNYLVLETSHQLPWDSYCNLIKLSKININTSVTQEAVKYRNSFLLSLLPQHVVTHRIWEGFCAGTVVVTNANEVLNILGFYPGIHYLDLDLLIDNNFIFPNREKLYRISLNGHNKFMELIT